MIRLKTFPKIDAHFHAFSDTGIYLKIAKEYTLHYININTDTDIFPPMQEQEIFSQRLMSDYPGYFSYIASFSMQNWTSGDWLDATLKNIDRSWKSGALGVKIWKNIGMEIVKANGEYLLVDDPFFFPFFKFLSDNHIPVVGHIGEPRNCWLPIGQMTSRRNRDYFSLYPQYHAYLYPEIPSYEKQIEARDHLLELFPRLTFIGAHLGSLEWNVKELSMRLEQYPNFAVDLSSRLSHIQLQARNSYEEIRHFFLQYADRIIYGTDAYNNIDRLQYALINDWDFLATSKKGYSPDIESAYCGLQLPEEILYKIYYENARRYYYKLASGPG